MGLREMCSAHVPEPAWHLGEPWIGGPGVARGRVHYHGFHPEVPGLVIAPFLLNVSDDSVLGGKRVHGREQLFRGFIVYSLLDSLS